MKKLTVFGCAVAAAVLVGAGLVMPVVAPAQAPAAQTPVLEIGADQVKGKSSPILHGLMTEEINYSYDGGLYAEQIRNRNFKEIPRLPRGRGGQPATAANGPRQDGLVYWSLVQTGGGSGSMEPDTTQRMNDAQARSLKLTVTSAGPNRRVGVSNEGYWGMAVRPNTQYEATVWAKGGDGFAGPLMLALVSTDGKTVYAQAQVTKITGSFQKYQTTLKTGAGAPATKDACFQIWAGGKGTVWLGFVSLFPPTYKNTPNGLRPDIMRMFADMRARFLRFPGGNYVEGDNLENRWNWKATVGPVEERPGHWSPWGYWSSDGLGLLEYLEWCEDLEMEPVMAVYSGYSLDRKSVPAGDDLKPYVQDALDQIEYTIGNASGKWGAQRIKDGHPAPFQLNFVEIGNEEMAGRSGYAERYAQFYDAIKAKYPKLQIVSSAPETYKIGAKIPDVVDDHHYMSPPGMLGMWDLYDKYDHSNPPLFIGEWATRLVNGSPVTPNLQYALTDSVGAMSFERNSDKILMQSYAPLLVNVNPGAHQWTCNLIGYDALNSYGGVSYYVLEMFGQNHGDTILNVSGRNVPTREVPMRGPGIDANDPRMRTVPAFYFDATRDSAGGTIYLKVSNPFETPQTVHVKIAGVSRIEPSGQLVELKGNSLEDTNTIAERTKIVPTTAKADGLGAEFTRTFPAYSFSVLILKGK